MLQHRVIPILLLDGDGLVKTVKFKKPKYVGDPINAIKIFNDKMVDELVFLDIRASKKQTGPNLQMLRNIAAECFMPLGYGGGITSTQEITEILNIGFEKVVLNTIAIEDPQFVRLAAEEAGSQSIVVSIDVVKNVFGKYKLYQHSSGKKLAKDWKDHLQEMVEKGAGEIVLNSVDRDGVMQGYDLELLKEASDLVKIPLVAAGGAGSVSDFREVIDQTRVSALAAGSLFVFHGPHKAVLINYPTQQKLKTILYG
jgi:cyclase